MKTGFWLRGGNGKLAGATVYQQNGETVMREVVTPANPKTNAQLLQRIIMHTIMSSYSKMKAITDHSFEGIKKGSDSMAFYIKQNVALAREKVAQMQAAGTDPYQMGQFLPLGMRGFVSNQYQVAMGSLPSIGVNFELGENFATPYISGFAENTYQDVIDTLGLQRGDQLTFCLIKNIPNATQLGTQEFHYCRVILDPTDPATGLQASLDTPFILEGAINYPSIRNEGNFQFVFNAANQIKFYETENVMNEAAFVIASRKNSDDTWMRSTTFVAIGHAEGYDLGTCLDYAKDGKTPIYSANELYLNNAGTGNAGEIPVGGDESSQPQVTAASVHGLSIVNGTIRNVEFPNGTEMPQNVTVAGTAINAEDGTQVAVYDGNSEVAHGEVADGEFSFTAGVTTGKTYKVMIEDATGEEYLTTGFQFTVSVNPNSGGGGDAPLDEG